jgi:general secretion pathway protein D
MILGFSTLGHAEEQQLKLIANEVISISQSLSEKSNDVSIDFPEPTDVKDIIKFYSILSGKNVVLGKGVSQKITIHHPQKLPKKEALAVITDTLREVGLNVVEEEKVIRITNF